MEEQPQDDYAEVGQLLAAPVVEGIKGVAWANELARLLGYTSADVERWTKRYRSENRRRLNKQSQRSRKRAQAIEEMSLRAKELIESYGDVLEQAKARPD